MGIIWSTDFSWIPFGKTSDPIMKIAFLILAIGLAIAAAKPNETNRSGPVKLPCGEFWQISNHAHAIAETSLPPEDKAVMLLELRLHLAFVKVVTVVELRQALNCFTVDVWMPK